MPFSFRPVSWVQRWLRARQQPIRKRAASERLRLRPELEVLEARLVPASTTTAVSSSLNPANFGQVVTFTAAVTPSSGTFDNGGTVQFAVNGTNFGPAEPLFGGTATVTDSSLPVGGAVITATYSGDSNFATSAGTLSGNQAVNKATTSTTVHSSFNPSTFDQMVTFIAIVAATSGTFDNGGTVQFQVNGSNYGFAAPLVSGMASIMTNNLDSPLPVGAYTVTAIYSGDVNFATSAGTLPGNQVVNPANTTTAVRSSFNPSTFGQAVTFTATVSTSPPATFDNGGTVQFQVNGTNFGTAEPLLFGGTATIMDSSLPVGTDTVTATYSGDTDFATSAGALPGNQVVNKAFTTTSVRSSSSPSTFGQAVTFTATVTAPLTTFDNGGTVQFQVNGTNFGVPQSLSAGGTATIIDSSPPGGDNPVTATYSGDSNFANSAGTLPGTQVVAMATTTTTVRSSFNPSNFGQPVIFTATVSAPPATFDNGGTVQFRVGSTNFGLPQPLSAGGTATIIDSSLPIGTDPVTATYSGDTDFSMSFGVLIGGQVVNPAIKSTTTAVSSSLNPSNFGQSVRFTATVTASSGIFDNGGAVQFAVDGSNFGSAVSLSGGTASISDPALSVGTHTITATYSGDTNFTNSTGTLASNQVVNKANTTTSVSTSINPSDFGQTVTFTATVSAPGVPFDNGGTVQFAADGVNIGSPALLSGHTATITDSTLSPGTHAITATYSGDTNFNTSTGTLGGGAAVNAPLSFNTPTTLPAWEINASVTTAIQATGGAGSFTYAVASGSLPTGLTLKTDGTISGVCAVYGSFTFGVTITDADGATLTQTFTWTLSYPRNTGRLAIGSR